jgi:hypothetical protein
VSVTILVNLLRIFNTKYYFLVGTTIWFVSSIFSISQSWLCFVLLNCCYTAWNLFHLHLKQAKIIKIPYTFFSYYSTIKKTYQIKFYSTKKLQKKIQSHEHLNYEINNSFSFQILIHLWYSVFKFNLVSFTKLVLKKLPFSFCYYQ